MTDERKTPDTDGVGDPLVSHTYEELANEHAPASLNEAVLRQASAASGKGYSGSMRWLRPMAWAATVTLSLAVVIQLADIPQAEFEADQAPQSNVSSPGLAADAVSPAAAAMMKDDVEAARRAPAESEEVGRMQSLQQEAAPAKLEEVFADTGASIDVTEARGVDARERAAETGGAAFYREDAPLVEEAESLAKMRSGPDDVPASAGLGSNYSAFSADLALEAPGLCAIEKQDTPEDWLACIEELEAAGMAELAGAERDLLMERYPDFEIAD